MKRLFLQLVLVAVTLTVSAQAPKQERGTGNSAHRKYQVSINAMEDQHLIDKLNRRFEERGVQRGLGGDILKSLASSFTQKTGTASSSIFELGVGYVTDLFKTGTQKQSFKSWYSTANGMNSYKLKLTSDEQIDDFYAYSSNKGALDPSDVKFNGFVFRYYIEEDTPSLGSPQNRKTVKPQNLKTAEPQSLTKQNAKGKEVCYLKCSLRTDDIGISHIANHSKFYLQVDTLMFNPKYCDLPNDSTSRMVASNFSFDTRKNLHIDLDVKVFSSWVNEAIIYTLDQKLGEFKISADINRKDLVAVGSDSLFIYSRNAVDDKTSSLVSISGECFTVPRSFIGTINEPVWGTGQYRLEMELSERCSLNEAYYMEMASPGSRKWKKDIWKAEWREMKKNKKHDTFWTNTVHTVSTAYIGSNWVKEVVDPVATVLLKEESSTLTDLFDLDAVPAAAKAASSAGKTPTGTSASRPK